MINYSFNDWQFIDYVREDGHMVVRVSIFRSGTEISSVDLVFDTGAYITVFSRPTAKKIGLPLGTGKPAVLRGFCNEHDIVAGELIEIPCMMLGKHFVYDAKAVVPLDDIEIVEVLGENVFEYFNYVIDHEKDVIYFQKNPTPKPYVNHAKGIDLSCGKVLPIMDLPD